VPLWPWVTGSCPLFEQLRRSGSLLNFGPGSGLSLKRFGFISWSNIAVGMARVVTALGESTIPDILPSQGQHESKRYACIKSPIPGVKIVFSMQDKIIASYPTAYLLL